MDKLSVINKINKIMFIKDNLEETYNALSANKIRSFLTILGIVIGVGSVIAMLAIGQGSKSSIESNIQSIGSNMILVSPGAQRGPGTMVSSGRGSAKSLTLADAEAIKTEINNIKAVSPEVSGRYQITAKGLNTNTQVYGATADYQEVRNLEISEGLFINEQNYTNNAKVAVIGPTVRDDLFGENAEGVPGQKVRINNMEFTVVGITKAKGGTGFNNQDDIIYIPLSTAQRFLTGNEYLNSISVSAIDAESTTAVQQDITELLLTRHNIADAANADFNTLNQTDLIATATSVTNTLSLLLAAVASISLIVGGIGIMNMMLTSVTERTKEIGLRKAIGAEKKEINTQFLTEAITLTFLGGIFGIILGWLVAYGVYKFANIATKVSMSSILLAFGVSAFIGIVFGYYPARRASKLNPIEALRYE
jgi:putative ABC transport system permease protein